MLQAYKAIKVLTASEVGLPSDNIPLLGENVISNNLGLCLMLLYMNKLSETKAAGECQDAIIDIIV
jgi:hypothetical protein